MIIIITEKKVVKTASLSQLDKMVNNNSIFITKYAEFFT